MRILGEVSGAGSHKFGLTVSGVKSRLDVFSNTAINDDSLYLPFSQWLNPTSSTASWLLSSASITGSAQITKLYGSLEVNKSVLYMLGKIDMLYDILAGKVLRGTYSQNGITLIITDIYSDNVRIAPIAKLPYETHKHLYENTVALSLRRQHIKTYEEIISNRDMSWYIDAKGNLKKDYKLITTLEQLNEQLTLLADYTYISIDTETTGINFFNYPASYDGRSEIVSLQLTWRENQGILVLFRSNVGECVDFSIAMPLIYTALKDKQLIYHNGIFDFKVFYSYGYVMPTSHDTLLLEFNFDSTVSKGSKGLKTLTRKYLNHETIELDEILGKNFLPQAILDIEPQLLNLYGCSDTDYTLQIFNILFPRLLNPISYNLDRQLTELIAVAEYNGAPINPSLLQALSDINLKDLSTIEEIMHKYLVVIGYQMIAKRVILATQGKDYPVTIEEVKELASLPEFQREVVPQLRHQTAKCATEDTGPLQFRGRDLRYILYDLLEYPVLKLTSNETPSTDKDAIDALLKVKASSVAEFLTADVTSAIAHSFVPHSKSEEVLISKSKMESYQYPFAYLLQIWGKLSKFRTSFFDKLLAESTCSYYFTSNSMTNAETARVINPVQTLVKSLKALVCPKSNDWYLVVFDMAQIEFRVMLGLANTYWDALVASDALPPAISAEAARKSLTALIENLNNPEKDMHREGGAIFIGCTPETMTSAERKIVKAVHFATPFGADAPTIAEPKLKKAPDYMRDQIISETEAVLSSWKNKFFPLYYYLEHVRDKALVPIPAEEVPLGLTGKYGKVCNPLGRYRLFDLSDQSYGELAHIRRMVGNFPIQSFAREIFFSGMLKLYKRLKKEGYIKGSPAEDKVVLNLFVHDECVMQVHKSIHPYEIYKYIYEEVLLRLKGHPAYYMGISVVDNWYEGKSDKYEAPINYVKECISKYDANPHAYENIDIRNVDYKQMAFNGIKEYFSRRVLQEIKEIQASEEDSFLLNPETLSKKLINYFVLSRVPLYSDLCRKPQYSIDSSITPSANTLMLQLDSYFVNTGAIQDYDILYENTRMHYSDLVNSAGEDDFDIDMDIDLSEREEDYEEQEERVVNECIQLLEPSISLDTDNHLAEPVNVEPPEETKGPPQTWIHDYNDNIIFDVTKLNREQFSKLVLHLRERISEEGYTLKFLKGGVLTDANVKVVENFDKEYLSQLYYGSGTNLFT